MRKLRSEEEIIASWKGDINKPVVSICCAAFNHESYIGDALEGFLIQETDFPFEVLIHDDASTDRTAEIIRKYEAKYPRLIKPIYQTENQYSKGIKISAEFIIPKANGKYIAFCEGDDCWISTNKLKVQVGSMRAEPQINISFHPSYKRNQKTQKKICAHSKKSKIFTPEEVIRAGGGFMPTASLMISREFFNQLPDWYYSEAPVGDLYYQMISSVDKGALFIPDIYSVYRVDVPGSWSSKQKKTTINNIKKHVFGHEKSLLAFNSDYKEKYNKDIDFALAREFALSSLNAMNNGFFELSKELLTISLKYNEGVNKIQFYLKIFNNHLWFLKLLLSIKNKFFRY